MWSRAGAISTPPASGPAAVSTSTSVSRPNTACCAPSSATRSPATRASSSAAASRFWESTPFFGAGGVSSVDIPLGYIQFGGFTAGRVQSFFDFWANDDIYTTLLGVSDLKTQTFAYTATFGSGWSATIAIEDPNERKSLTNGLDLGGFPRQHLRPRLRARRSLSLRRRWRPRRAGRGLPTCSVSCVSTRPGALPSWLWRRTRSAPATSSASTRSATPSRCFRAAAGGLTDIDTVDSEWGYAIQGGVKFNLPMIAAGDQLWLQAAYADGAPGYTHAAPFTTARAGTFRLNATEAVIDPLTGDVEKTDSWSVSGKFLHYWLPNLRSNFFAAYSELDYSDVGPRSFFDPANPSFVVNTGFSDLRIIEAGANLIWSPVKGLDIGVEGVYRKFETKATSPRPSDRPLTVGGVGDRNFFQATDSQDVWEARLRVQRDF